ncbi:UPF0739 protein C1orf74 homolog [Lytechinus variegatus]|uniref:UPF0739 protein C1orf74 homolog n=1 Tax=Lytechinus variegatus TaxID=7654 RepID=UPI001BB1CFA3|nr:UPF0739 protein C1orf74 homolog [Lytechinus variegatus]XP_041461012.1 UPF0739 protein C1orf74 homolog [Lytechinus variegatus]
MAAKPIHLHKQLTSMDFRKQISRFLGKAAHRRWKDVASDIMAVIGGIKPGFLYDYSTCDSKSLDKLVAEMESLTKWETQKADISPSPDSDSSEMVANHGIRTTGTLNIKDDVVVFNKEILIRKLKHFIFTMKSNATDDSDRLGEENPYTLVDVSGKLSNPTLADRSITQEIVIIAKDILTQIEAEFADPRRSSGEVAVTIHIEDHWNVSTIFGLLLGYPVLYWYQVDTQDNCLAYTPLSVIKCTCKCMVKTNNCGSENVCRSVREMSNHDHVMYSFSIPSIFLEHASKRIAEWKESICHAVDLCEYFTSASFECNTVTLPIVAL